MNKFLLIFCLTHMYIFSDINIKVFNNSKHTVWVDIFRCKFYWLPKNFIIDLCDEREIIGHYLENFDHFCWSNISKNINCLKIRFVYDLEEVNNDNISEDFILKENNNYLFVINDNKVQMKLIDKDQFLTGFKEFENIEHID